MNNATVVRALPVAIAAVAISGIAVAASAAAKPSGYTACTNSKHQLSLTHHGKCAKHSHKVSVGARGATGPSDVYVATGNVNVASPAIRSRSRISPAPPVHLSLPAGSYLVSWQVQFDTTFSETGMPADKEYTALVDCSPTTPKDGFGQSDIVTSTVVPDNYSGTSSFRFDLPLRGLWALKVPAGGTKITMNCQPPMLTNLNGGAAADATTNTLSGQIEATRTGTIHGNDNGTL